MAREDKSEWGRKLVSKIVCPNCWHSFSPDSLLFVSKHPELVGDPVAGENEYRRFEPFRFNVAGEALDEMGFATDSLACPRCHLAICEAMLEVTPLLISVVGSPASGKSYSLAAMAWELRRLLPQMSLSFSDADPTRNSAIHEYEQTLFMNPQPDELTEIRKTQRDDPRLYQTVMLEGAPVRFPLPLQFALWPTPKHPRYQSADKMGGLIVMYDNAGEDFLPGADSGATPGVQHLAKSHMIFMFFDPAQDPRFRDECDSDDPQLTDLTGPGREATSVAIRQETLLQEAGVKVRRYMGIAPNKRIDKPLIIVVSKADVWANMLDMSMDMEPYGPGNGGASMTMDVDRVDDISNKIRGLMRRLCPEFVATAENLSTNVRYIPVSALGTSPEIAEHDGRHMLGIRPRNISPRWVTVPLLYCLCKWARGLITPASAADKGRGIDSEP